MSLITPSSLNWGPRINLADSIFGAHLPPLHHWGEDSEPAQYPFKNPIRTPAIEDGRAPLGEWTAVIFPDRFTELSTRLIRSLVNSNYPPSFYVNIPESGIYPEQRAWLWALEQVNTEFVAHLDADMVLDPSTSLIALSHFASEKVACVCAQLRDPINRIDGNVKFWRTEALRALLSKNTLREVIPDTSLEDAAKRQGLEILRLPWIGGDHGYVLDPLTVFRINLRRGIKARARNRLSSASAMWGIENAMRVGTGWAHIALLGFHAGLMCNYDRDPHDAEWASFSYNEFRPLESFCRMLAQLELQKSTIQFPRDRRLRVLLASNSFLIGGVETSMVSLAEGLDQKSFEVGVAYESHGNPSLCERLSNRGIHHWNLSEKFGGRDENAWTRLLQEWRPDTIISFLASTIYFPALSLNIPMIERPPGWNGHSKVPKMFFRHVVCESDTFRKELVSLDQFAANAANTTMIPNPVNRSRFKPISTAAAKAHLGLNVDKPLIGCVARVDPIKNIETIIKALSHVRSKFDANLIILGRCETDIERGERRKLEVLASDLKISNYVHFKEPVEDVASYLNAFDVVVLSSLTEGVPNCLLEAAECRRPIVASDVGGIREFVGSKAVLVADPQDDMGFANAIREILSSGIKSQEYSLPDLSAMEAARQWEGVIRKVHYQVRKDFPSAKKTNRIRIGLLMDTLEIGGMEMFVRLFDKFVDRSKFEPVIYSYLDGPIASTVESLVRIVGWPTPNGRFNLLRWLFRDRVDGVIIVSALIRDLFLEHKVPFPVIERLDGLFVKRRASVGASSVVVHQAPTLLAKTTSTERTVLIENGRDLDKYRYSADKREDARTRLGLTKTDLFIGNVGRLGATKNQIQLIRLLKLLHRSNFSNCHIGIIGTDNDVIGLRDQLLGSAREAGLEKYFHLLEGSVDRVPSFLNACDLYVHSSLDEGLSGALIEAAAAGLPIVASNCGAVADIVFPDNGTIVPINDDEAMFDAVVLYLQDSDLRWRSGLASRRNAGRFDAQVMTKKYEELIVSEVNDYNAQRDRFPQATFIMPVHGRVDLLDKAIKTILDQTITKWKMIITIGTETPPTDLLAHLSRYFDSRIEVVKDVLFKNHSAAMNAAVARCKSDYFVKVDSDDEISSNALSVLLENLKVSPDIDYFYSGLQMVYEPLSEMKNYVVEAEPFSPTRLEEWFISHPLAMISRRMFYMAGGFDENIRFGEDYDLALRMLLAGAKFSAIPDVLYHYRQHNGDRVSNEFSAERQRKSIDNVRLRYSELKRRLGVSWNGERPGDIAVRRRVRADA